MKTNLTFRSLFSALLMVVLIFIWSFTTFAQQNSVEAQAKRDAEADMNKLLWTGVGFAAYFGVILTTAAGGLIGHTASPGGSDPFLSDGAACGICVGMTFGASVPFTLIYRYKLTSPAERLLGKSPEYIAFYTDTYKTRTRQLRGRYAAGGCGIAVMIGMVVGLIGGQI